MNAKQVEALRQVKCETAGDEYKPGMPVEIRIRDAWVRASYERPHQTSGYHWVQREENALGQRKRQIVGGIKIRRAS